MSYCWVWRFFTSFAWSRLTILHIHDVFLRAVVCTDAVQCSDVYLFSWITFCGIAEVAASLIYFYTFLSRSSDFWIRIMFNSRRLERCDISSFCYTTTVCIILFSHFEFVYVSLFYISCDLVYIVLLFLYISFLCLNPSSWWNQRQYVYSLSVHRCVRSWVVVSGCSPVLFIRFQLLLFVVCV